MSAPSRMTPSIGDGPARASGFHLCTGCDAIRDQERAFCDRCGEATDSYAYEPTEREAYTLSQVEAEELAVQFGFQREPHTSLIHLGEAA